MIHSKSKQLHKLTIPSYNGEIKMLPFNLSSLDEVPEQFRETVRSMTDVLPELSGTAYLTVDGKIVEVNNSHRRGGAHIDGNYLAEMCNWGNGGGGNGWKVGEGGRQLNTSEHQRSYRKETGGMLIASTYPSCRGWDGSFEGEPNIGGDCSHIQLPKGFMLLPNVLYYGNSQWIHESLPVKETVHRTIIRITLPEDYPSLK